MGLGLIRSSAVKAQNDDEFPATRSSSVSLAKMRPAESVQAIDREVELSSKR